MKLIVTVLILAFARSSSAANADIVCADCEYSDGLGYVPYNGSCIKFHQCTVDASGSVSEVLLCCPPRTVWDQEILNCKYGICYDSRDNCPDVDPIEDMPCPYNATDDVKEYLVLQTGDVRTCADGTVFDVDVCTCVHGGDSECRDDPLLYFPFAHHFNDIQCHKVAGMPHGDAHLELEEGCLRLDGEGDYLTFGFLNNWFAGRENLESFTVSIWFNQTEAGWDNLNNSPIEGLFGNGECDQASSIWLAQGNETLQGGVRTDGGDALFDMDDTYNDVATRFYLEPLIWCQMAIRWTDTEVTLFLNGNVTAVRTIGGDLRNTQAASTVGLTFLECLPYFFTGCLDDLMVFDRFVSDYEMVSRVFGRGRTPGWSEAPYTRA